MRLVRPGDLVALDRAIRRGAPLRAAGRRGGGGRISRRGGGALPWTPAALGSKLKLWLDQRDLVVTGLGYSDWGNQAGASVDFTQATDSFRPAADTTINGFAAPNFDGADNRMDSTSLLSDISAADAFEFAMVYLPDTLGADVADASAFDREAVFQSGSALSPRLVVSATTSGVKLTVFDGAAFDNTPYAAISTGVASLITGRLDAGSLYVRVGADAEVSAAGGPQGDLTRILRIGANRNATAFCDGKLATIVWCNAVLSAAERASLRAYLAAKYGVTA